jgi:hypothetical protein
LPYAFSSPDLARDMLLTFKYSKITTHNSLNITIKSVHGKEIEPFLADLAHLRIEIFREYPYLYDGSMEYEESYLQTYIQSKDSLAVLVFNGTKLVGASTGVPMSDETDDFRRPFEKNGYDTSDIFYFGESVLKKEYRGLGIYSSFFSVRENHARNLNRFSRVCFCAVERKDNHPLKPEHYQPLDPIWTKFGYKKHPGLQTTYTWKDINEDHETEKKMIFWLKKL